MDLKERAKQLKTDIPALYLCLKSKETPVFPKILAAITVAYALSPVDLIPDFIPVLGYLDDIFLLPALIALIIRLIPKETLWQFREEAKGLWENGRPKKWYFAIPIIAVWLCILWLAVGLLLNP
ncbi:YkvA family protein [Pseudoflavonifractor phocaeensis]|uniref:YkvA family protein n=1 Tax=Pseudoflavonifractor phocaeensis TaxID=1870988 RepID=UPI00210B4188|nr:YkvA family protein [Pseudoflavonifractor phocaeensis]MCQ4866289.1 YkvA family protein [Pseudoflavonifractor phocaeensis]